jgi:hypothetical protein
MFHKFDQDGKKHRLPNEKKIIKIITIFLFLFFRCKENTNVWLNTYISYMVYSHIFLKLMHGFNYFCKSLSMIANLVTKIIFEKPLHLEDLVNLGLSLALELF